MKPPEPAETLEGTHLSLYGGFGKGEASNLKESSPPSPSPKPSQPISAANQSQPPSSLQKPRPVLASEHKQRLSNLAQRQQDQLQALHTLNNRLDSEQTTPEYRTARLAHAFARVRRILERVRATSVQRTPSPPS